MPFPKRDSQTRIKHEILRAYAGAWAGIIGTGVEGWARQAAARGHAFQLDLIYVDGYGGFGRYLKDSDKSNGMEPIWGSPILAMQALEQTAKVLSSRGIPVRLTAIVTEEKKANFEELVSNLAAAKLGTPHRISERWSPALLGHIALIRGDFRDHLPDILANAGDRFMLAFVDPYGPSMPMELLAKLIGRPRTDVIALFPVEDIDRKSGSGRKPLHLQGSGDRGNVTRITSHFGTEDWIKIAEWLADIPTDDRREEYAKLYDSQLRAIDPLVWVKNIGLRMSSMDRTLHHFFLTTRDADGAIRMNDILRDARLQEYYAVWQDAVERSRRRDEESPQESLLSLFDMELPTAKPPEPVIREAAPEEVDQAVLDLCPHNKELQLKEVFGHLADTPFLEGEIKAALKRLRSRGRAKFDSLDRKKKLPIVITD